MNYTGKFGLLEKLHDSLIRHKQSDSRIKNFFEDLKLKRIIISFHYGI